MSKSGKFNITEVKESLGSGGADIGSAVKQIENTYKALQKKLPNAELGNLQISLPKGANLDGGYSVSGNQLVKITDSGTEVIKIGGKVVNVAFQ